VLFLAFSLLCVSCTKKSSPVEVKGEQKFGKYVFIPPEGYWFFEKKDPMKIETSKDNYLITFWKDKDEISNKQLKRKDVIFNFGVSANIYKDITAYYNEAQKAGVAYKAVPEEMNKLKTIPNWSCKEPVQDVFGIECVSLRDELVIFGFYGYEKSEVISSFPVFLKMIESFKIRDNP
jgi:hypothetical protein